MKNLGDKWAIGKGLFETLRVEDGEVFALHRHHCRAKETAAKLGFEIPSEADVAKASHAVIHSENFPLARMRWHFDREGEFSISYVEYSDPTQAAGLMIFDERSAVFEIQNKEYPYRNLELLEIAKARGFDDGIIIRSDGQVAETSMASLMLKMNDEWFTPPLASGILNGVVRALVLEAGLAKVQRIMDRDLSSVQSGLLLTSLRNAQSIGAIDGRELQIDTQKCDEIHKLMKEFKGR
jgi:branched-subunit amino acid aminotransferase/4-amino-4-deoxychorismate lyase